MNITCFTHNDLDGVVCGLIITWYYTGDKVNIIPTTPSTFRQDFHNWTLKHSVDSQDAIYITDLDVSKDSDILDHTNIIIVDHHESHDKNSYKRAVPAIKVYSSASLLLYKVLRAQTGRDITKEQKILVLLADDYDSYKLQIPLSKKLNYIYYSTQNRFETFLSYYAQGFRGFTPQQENMYILYTKELNSVLSDLDCYSCKSIEFNDKKFHAVSAILNKNTFKFRNDIADFLFVNLQCDFAILFCVDNKVVSLRRNSNKTKDISMCEFAKHFLEDTGGHEAAAGGNITDAFIELTKQFTPIFTG